MEKKIEIWILYLIVIIFFITIILFGGLLRDALLNKNVIPYPKTIKKLVIFISEIPKNLYFVYNKGGKPNILVKNSSLKNGFNNYIETERDLLLVLPKYNNELERSEVEIIDLKNFKIIHTYRHDINSMYELYDDSRPEIKKSIVDDAPIRFEYRHPLILKDGSLISDSDYSPIYRLDVCSKLLWLNQEKIFHHSKMLDHEGNIWVPARMYPYSEIISDTYKDFGEYEDDAIAKINSDGKVLYIESVSEILLKNKIIGDNIFLNKFSDPIHLNDIEPALEDSEYWKKGDLFLSIRHQSSILHYRPSTSEIINYIKGPFFMQHDVDIISNKEISIFNNNNSPLKNSNSEILIYNFETKKFSKKFNVELINEEFKTYSQGISEILNDGSMLVEEQNRGRLIFFNNKGEKEWEYVNKDNNNDVYFISWSRIIENKALLNSLREIYKQNKCKK